MSEAIRAILEGLAPENWGRVRQSLFEAIVEAGLDAVEAEAVLREAAKRVGATLQAVRQAWQDFLGPKKEDTTAAKDAVDLALEAGPQALAHPQQGGLGHPAPGGARGAPSLAGQGVSHLACRALLRGKG
jgi:hypothetical protein